MNSYVFFIYEFIYFMNSYMNSGVPRFQMPMRGLQLPNCHSHGLTLYTLNLVVI